MTSGYSYMVKRFVYLSVSTHTLLPSPHLLLYPLSGASRVTHMLTLIEDTDTALGGAVPTGPPPSQPQHLTAHRPFLKIIW